MSKPDSASMCFIWSRTYGGSNLSLTTLARSCSIVSGKITANLSVGVDPLNGTAPVCRHRFAGIGWQPTAALGDATLHALRSRLLLSHPCPIRRAEDKPYRSPLRLQQVTPPVRGSLPPVHEKICRVVTQLFLVRIFLILFRRNRTIKLRIVDRPRWDLSTASRTRTDEAVPLGFDHGFPTPRVNVPLDVPPDTDCAHHTHHAHDDSRGIP